MAIEPVVVCEGIVYGTLKNVNCFFLFLLCRTAHYDFSCTQQTITSPCAVCICIKSFLTSFLSACDLSFYILGRKWSLCIPLIMYVQSLVQIRGKCTCCAKRGVFCILPFFNLLFH